MALGVGEVFAGYTVIRQLGAGGMGEVYLAEHPRLPRQDALKILRAEISADSGFRQRFIREADSVAALSHPNIVTVFDRGETDGRLWIATQYVGGTDAAQMMRDRYPAGMPADEALAIITAIGDALDYAHTRGLLHRDVKPANILLSDPERDGRRRVFLADFGIARPLGDSSGLTATNFTVGTVAYAAPEQLLGADIDGRADQYALAATAFHLLTGSPPFEDSNPVAVISKHLTQLPPRVGALRPDLTGLEQVMASAMAKDPSQRYTDCAEFTAALTRAAAINPVLPHAPTQAAVPAPRPSAPVPASPSTPAAAPPNAPPVVELPVRQSRRRVFVGAAALLMLAVAMIGVGYNIIRGYYYVGAHEGQVSIMRGVQGTFLGVPLQQPYQFGCINGRGELSQISYGRADTPLDCEPMRLVDLRSSDRDHVIKGLPAGSLDQAIGQLRELVGNSSLPPAGPTTSGSGSPGSPSSLPPAGPTTSGSGSPGSPSSVGVWSLPIKLSEPVTDLSRAVDPAAAEEVRSAAGQLQRQHDVRLWVVYVQGFTSSSTGEPMPAVDWAKQTIELSELGDRDAILAVATEERSYAFLVSPAAGPGGQAAVDNIRENGIEPALRNSQWADAGVAAATGLAALAP
jgi:serine/threonine-protein kinase